MPTKTLAPILVLLLTACGGGSGDSSSSRSTAVSPNEVTSQGTFADRMLAAVNNARASTQMCGATTMPPVGPLTWDYNLESAAYRQSSDMANGDFMSHTGSDGSTLTDRVNDSGYSWSRIGENVAVGQNSINVVVSAWMASEGHCKNIMNGNFNQMGASLVENHSGRYGYYWTQVFAQSR